MEYDLHRKRVADLFPYINNSRTHSDEQVNQVAASIAEFGFTNPVLIDESGMLIAGHGRIMAAKKLGMEEVPCIVLDGLTKAQKKAYVIADNKLALNAGWDNDLLRVELEGLDELGFDLDLLGFSDEELSLLLEPEQVDGLTDEDAVPDVPEQPISVLGDIWQLGDHRLMCGDSTSIDAVDLLLDGIKPNAVFTDPPYGIGLDKENQKIGKSQSYGSVLNDGDSDVAKEAFNLAVSLNVPELYFWGANHYSSVLPDSSCWIVWDKQGGKSVTYAD